MRSGRRLLVAALVATALCATDGRVHAASHSDAPLIKQDPQANITDVYAFLGTRYDDTAQQVLNVVVHVRPFSEPGDGPHYERFADDALYGIHVADPASGETLLRYDFRFSAHETSRKNPDTLLSYGLGSELGPVLDIGDARQNFTQTYDVSRTGGRAPASLATGLVTAPPNVGVRTTPAYNDAGTGAAVSGATQLGELDVYTQQAIHDLPGGEAVFAGPREDGFYADIAGIFDLLDPRILDNDGDTGDGLGQDGGGADTFKGFNVLAYAIQIPLSSLEPRPYASPFFGTKTGVGVYASVSRPKNVRQTRDGPRSSGRMVQLNRMGNPIFNETFVALADKDRHNRESPVDDATGFAHYAASPELGTLINAVFGSSIVTTGRSDLTGLFIPDVLRVDTSTGPVRLPGQSGFSRLGFLGGDFTAGASNSGGWPNGRRFGDDVVDIALTALVSGPSYAQIVLVGDNVAANDQVYHQVFPYSATPHAGAMHRHD